MIKKYNAVSSEPVSRILVILSSVVAILACLAISIVWESQRTVTPLPVWVFKSPTHLNAFHMMYMDATVCRDGEAVIPLVSAPDQRGLSTTYIDDAGTAWICVSLTKMPISLDLTVETLPQHDAERELSTLISKAKIQSNINASNSLIQKMQLLEFATIQQIDSNSQQIYKTISPIETLATRRHHCLPLRRTMTHPAVEHQPNILRVENLFATDVFIGSPEVTLAST